MRKNGGGVHDSCLKCTLPGANGTGVECRMERKGGEARYRMVKATKVVKDAMQKLNRKMTEISQ